MPTQAIISTFGGYSLLALIAFFVPGILIIFVKSQFTTGESIDPLSKLFPHLAVSLVYFGTLLPFAYLLESWIREVPFFLPWVGVVLILPVFLGLLLGWNAKNGYLPDLLGLVHTTPTAWDWKFFKRESFLIRVQLKSGRVYCGRFHTGSFASSRSWRARYLHQRPFRVQYRNQGMGCN